MLPIPLLAVATLASAEYTNIADGSPLVVLNAAREDDTYYNSRNVTLNRYYDIIDFLAKFRKILTDNDVNVVVSCTVKTCEKLRAKGVPNDVLWRAGIYDIWMRDMSRVNPNKQVGFQFQPAYIEPTPAAEIQKSFDDAVKKAGLRFSRRSDWVIDGGNVVDNYVDTAILTDRVLAENELSPGDVSYAENQLAPILGYKKVCLVPEIDGDTTGHSDGMVSFLNRNTILYSDFDQETYDLEGVQATVSLVEKLQLTLPSVKLVKVPYIYPGGNTRDTQGYRGFTSGCGTHINALYTGNKMFVPTFGTDPLNEATGLTTKIDKVAVDIFKANAGPTEVIEVPVPKKVCEIGGNVRCLSWLVNGENANRLISYVQRESRYY